MSEDQAKVVDATEAPPPEVEKGSTEGQDQQQTFPLDYVKSLREEAKKHRLKAEQLESDQEKAREELRLQQMTEQERLTAKITGLESELNASRAQTAQATAVARLTGQVADADAAVRLIGDTSADFENEEGVIDPQKVIERWPFLKPEGNLSPRPINVTNPGDGVVTDDGTSPLDMASFNKAMAAVGPPESAARVAWARRNMKRLQQ